MKINQYQYLDGAWDQAFEPTTGNAWILAFGQRGVLSEAVASLQNAYPNASLVASSTSGEIHGDEVHDNSVTANVVVFDKTTTKLVAFHCPNSASSAATGEQLGKALAAPHLKHVFVVSNGLTVNGTALASSLQQAVGAGVSISGGLAGDGADFKETLVIAGAETATDLVAAVGFYGEEFSVSCGSWGGWQPFGPIRVVTKSEGSVLHELDDKSALSKYKEYLGEQAGSLPANALLFPILIQPANSDRKMVRTVLAIDEEAQTMTFAGDVPLGATVQLMRSNTESLVDGAKLAAEKSHEGRSDQAQLAILVSCVGRKLVMKQRVEEEVEAVREVLGPQAAVTGFYSYGELSPRQTGAPCDLHNQTMTVTLLSEA